MTDSLAKLRKECEKTHQVKGEFDGVKWSLTLAYRRKGGQPLEEISGAALRFNMQNNFVALFLSKVDLQTYETRMQANRDYLVANLERVEQLYLSARAAAKSERSLAGVELDYKQKVESIYNYQPYAPQTLANSSAAAYNFDLSELQETIKKASESLVKQIGVLPKISQLVPLCDFSGFQAALKIWKS